MDKISLRKARSEWRKLNAAILRTLKRHGGDDAVTRGAVWLSEAYSPGWYLQSITLMDLNLLRPDLVTELQILLAEHRDWSIELQLAPDERSDWTDMIIEIAHDRIVDRIRHELLPEMLRGVRFGTTIDEYNEEVAAKVRRLMRKPV